MADDFSFFQAFSRERRKAEALDTSTGHVSLREHHASLINIRAVVRSTQTTKNPRGEAFRFVPGFVEKMTPNAFADRHEDAHMAGFHSALFASISEFALFCFTQKDFFPDIGDPSVELSPSPIDDRVPGIWLLDFTKQGGHVEDHHGEKVCPKNPDRYIASVYLAQLMARFVWLHEFSHCFNGHVDFVRDRNIALCLNEISEDLNFVDHAEPPPSLPEEDRDEILKCLELDADQSAFWASCNIQIGNRESFAGIAELELATRMRMMLFGAYAMTWLFDEFETYLGAKHGKTHPAPYVRLQNIIRTAETNVAPLHGEFIGWHRDTCGQFDAIARRIPRIYNADRLHAALQENGEDIGISAFDQRLSSLKAELKKFQFSAKT